MNSVLTKYRGDLALVLVTLIWGSTFTITKLALAQVTPLIYLAIRFSLGFMVLSLFFGRRMLKLKRNTIGVGLLVGLILFLGYAAQTIGMKDPGTTASKAGFITGMSVIFTPLLSVLFLKQKPTFYAVIGAIISFFGLAFLSIDGKVSLGVSWGDMLELLCAIAFAGHIVAVGRFAADVETGSFTTLQIGVVGLLCGLAGLGTEPWPGQISAGVWWGLIFMATLATAGTLLIQNWAQKFTTPTRTAVIFTLEPVFAALFAILFLGDQLTGKSLVGAVLILGGLLLAEYSPVAPNAIVEDI